jgi:hypothetical protein
LFFGDGLVIHQVIASLFFFIPLTYFEAHDMRPGDFVCDQADSAARRCFFQVAEVGCGGVLDPCPVANCNLLFYT